MAETETPGLRFKIATEDWEFQQIHRLNYETFVEEIPQHAPNGERILVDRFHDENTYVIALRGGRLVGMLALRGRRPFSLDGKLPDLDRHLPPGRRPCEVRLLATTADGRHGAVFRGLAGLLARHALEGGYDLALISGTVRQTKLYRHLGFTPFGPLVGGGEALYQPMSLTLETYRRQGRVRRALNAPLGRRMGEPLNFLPGPVTLHPEVQAALQRPAISHRSPEFRREFEQTRRELCRLAGARHVQILMGSGTLANDVIAAELSLTAGHGLILSNGAFGERLIDHAARFGLDARTLRFAWGGPLDRRAVEDALDGDRSIRWIWFVHGETSTGVLNDLDALKSVAAPRGVRLCVDAVSSLGTTPVDLRGVSLASGVSGKGLGAPAGLAFVFHEDPPWPASERLPRYLDLGFYAAHGGVPFTLSSNWLAALNAALVRHEGDQRYAALEEFGARLRTGLAGLGLGVVAETDVFPAVTTVALPPGCDSVGLGERLEDDGFLVHFRSDYLRERNWVQICLMGHCTAGMIEELLAALGDALGRIPGRTGTPARPGQPAALKAGRGTGRQ